MGGRDIRGCVACGGCAKLGKCAFDDIVNEQARNMAFLMKSIALGKETYGLLEKEPRQVTNFIR